MKFIDYTKITVKSGKGGNGCVAFLREKFRPKGGPSGGDGGHGGSVIFLSNSKLSTLQDFSYKNKYIAPSGQHGKGKNMHGRNGDNIILNVPVGTILKNIDSGKVIYDFKNDNEELVIVKGGNGGFGNARFKTQNNPAPRNSNDGEEGIELNLELELKIIADVGLVGFPNAGKSTYISSISNAKPKIADYPFTTLYPNLGIVKYGSYNSFVVADIPGLIEDASKGKGLGSQFLKHIERTRVLVYMLDPTQGDIVEQYQKLNNELATHNKNILKKEFLIIITKKDVFQDKLETKKLPKGIKVNFISSISGDQVTTALQSISTLL